MVREDAHQQRAVEGVPRLDEGREPLVRRGQRRHRHVLAANPRVGDQVGGGEALAGVLDEQLRGELVAAARADAEVG